MNWFESIVENICLPHPCPLLVGTVVFDKLEGLRWDTGVFSLVGTDACPCCCVYDTT